MRPTELIWAGGEHPFLLTIELLRALQTKCDAGPAFILQRLSTGQWRVDDVIQTIRLGLEGGGASKQEALMLVRQYVEDEPITGSVQLAHSILAASLFGVDDDPVGEPTGETDNQNLSPADAGASQDSTKPAVQSE